MRTIGRIQGNRLPLQPVAARAEALPPVHSRVPLIQAFASDREPVAPTECRLETCLSTDSPGASLSMLDAQLLRNIKSPCSSGAA